VNQKILRPFIQLSLNVMKLCHIMSAHPENFPFSLECPLYGLHSKPWMAAKYTRF